MKKLLILAALTCLALTSGAFAQGPPPPPDAQAGPPPEIVLKEFLGLDEGQFAAFQALLETRHQAIQVILPQLEAAERALGDALKNPAPDPAQVGTLLLVAHGFREQLRNADLAALSGFHALLTAEQLAKVGQLIALLQAFPALDAMQRLHLLPPPGGDPTDGASRGFPPPPPAPARSFSR